MAKAKKSDSDVRKHPNNPCNQPFNINGNRTGKKGWWTRI